MKLLRLLLFPFSLLYGAILYIRHFLYDNGQLRSTYFGKKVLVIGNLIVGGAGKSPMTEYLIELLAENKRLAVLSRGYGRITKGYVHVEMDSDSKRVGDEPLQIKRKFPHITVADCEDRVKGVQHLIENHDLIILDDAFQHRALKPGVSILLFDYPRLFDRKWLLPAGDYRDLFSRRHAAHVIVVTKCPPALSDQEKQRCMELLHLKKPIPVFFSDIRYQSLVHFKKESVHKPILPSRILTLSGVAYPAPFIAYLRQRNEVVDSIIFPDHHIYNLRDIDRIVARWKACGENTIIVTTEKDAMRLRDPALAHYLERLPLFYLPIKHGFFEEDRYRFNQTIGKILDS